MKPGRVGVTDVLDGAESLTAAVAAPWVGVLWLSAMPLRFLQAHFVDRLVELGDEAGGYGRYLGELSLAIGLAFLLSLVGRAVYVRACRLRLGRGTNPGREAWRLPPGPLAGYLYTALLLELGFLALALTLLPIPVFVLLSGLAAASWELGGGPGLVRPLKVVFGQSRALRPLLGALLLLGVALLVVWINLFLLFQVGLALAQGTTGLDLGRWQGLLGGGDRTFRLLVLAGAWLLLEPYWLSACVVAVRRTRARRSGEDLRGRLAALRRRGLLPALMAVFCLAAVPARGEEVLSAADYRRELASLEGELRSGEWEGGRERAARLAAARVDHGGETLPADVSVLEPAAEVATGAEARRAAAAVSALAAALAEGGAGGAPAPDPARLARLEAAQRLAELPAGGEVGLPELEPPSFWRRVIEALAAAGDWLLQKLVDFLEWLFERFRGERGERPAGGLDTRWVTVLVVLVAVGLVLLAWRMLRARGEAEAEAEAVSRIASAPSSDADPRSREVDEWQRYARELEAEGRLREAIRAWYHAVLASLYRSGHLRYRKGRTNWEHVATLAPSLAWRGDFIALTRTFEAEWYGHAESGAEALERCIGEARRVLEGVASGRLAA